MFEFTYLCSALMNERTYLLIKVRVMYLGNSISPALSGCNSIFLEIFSKLFNNLTTGDLFIYR